MWIASLRHFLTTTTDKTPRSRQIFWFCLSMAIALMYAIPALEVAFSGKYVAQDDARQHLFWMFRFIDPDLFPNDFLADYFQSVAPKGFAAVYHAFTGVGIDPLLAHRFLPLLIMLVSTAYGFGVCLQILPIPAAGFLTALLLNQTLWMKDDVVSATAVAFVYPIFLAFLYYLLRRSLLPCLVAIALQGLFYPQCVFIFAGLLLLRSLTNRDQLKFCLAGLAVSFLVMLPYALQPSVYGPVITLAQARPLHIFSSTGWSAYFTDSFREFWLCGKRSGMIPNDWCKMDWNANLPIHGLIPQTVFSLALPLVLLRPDKYPLVRQINQNWIILPQILLVSLFWFFLAHALAFKLHLPNRYTEHSLRIIASLAAAIALLVLLDALLQVALTHRSIWKAMPPLVVAFVLAVGLFVYPSFTGQSFPSAKYVTRSTPELYEFFAQQPKDTVIASLDPEANNIPIFARRTILVGSRGFSLPYHLAFFREVRQRSEDLIRAQYSPDLAQVKQFIQQYGVDFWLLERSTFQPNYLSETPIFREFSEATAIAQSQLQPGKTPILAELQRSCTASRIRKFTVVDAQCILNQPA